MAEIQTVSHMHEQIMNWLLLNPGVSQKVCAAKFGITESWLSSVIHSDAFQAKFKEKQTEVFGMVVQTVPEKLTALADIVCDKLGEALEKTNDKDFTLDAFDIILSKAGYGAKGNGLNAQNNTLNVTVVSSDTLAAARQSMLEGRIPAVPRTIDMDAIALPENTAEESRG
jgi:hypothetical protein